jgi:predicted TPR repeat methyltransferase
MYASLSMHGPAADAWREALSLRPGDRGLTLSLARSLVAAGDLPAARRALDVFLSLHPEDETTRAYRKSLGE